MEESRGASVLFDTTLGPLVIDLFTQRSPNACRNFLALVANGYYENDVVHSVHRDGWIALGNGGGDGTGHIFRSTHPPDGFPPEGTARPCPVRYGTVVCATNRSGRHGSGFLITTARDSRMQRLGDTATILGVVSEGMETTLPRMNGAITSSSGQPLRRIRVRAAHVLYPLDDPVLVPRMARPAPGPAPKANGEYLPSDDEEEADNDEAVAERMRARQMRKQEYLLQLLGELPADPNITAPENVLFVCKLNPLTQDADLSQFFMQFGKVLSCEVLRDPKSKQSLQYAFVEFETVEGCRNAYARADNVLIDDRRIHVDFSQSVKHLWKKERLKMRGDPKRQKM